MEALPASSIDEAEVTVDNFATYARVSTLVAQRLRRQLWRAGPSDRRVRSPKPVLKLRFGACQSQSDQGARNGGQTGSGVRLADFVERGRRLATVAARARALRVFSHWIVTDDYVRTDPIEKRKVPKVPNAIVETFTTDR